MINPVPFSECFCGRDLIRAPVERACIRGGALDLDEAVRLQRVALAVEAFDVVPRTDIEVADDGYGVCFDGVPAVCEAFSLVRLHPFFCASCSCSLFFEDRL